MYKTIKSGQTWQSRYSNPSLYNLRTVVVVVVLVAVVLVVAVVVILVVVVVVVVRVAILVVEVVRVIFPCNAAINRTIFSLPLTTYKHRT